jgi:hypothetical protein
MVEEDVEGLVEATLAVALRVFNDISGQECPAYPRFNLDDRGRDFPIPPLSFCLTQTNLIFITGLIFQRLATRYHIGFLHSVIPAEAGIQHCKNCE